ncbi:hypothetical protein [Ensifer sp. BR816]|uniref:hypothetical protein n=1 Tax=Rhizobium sp. (strain BR816) TaxID=1057002 RepID=UPI000373E59E|nr:hypothetical protein [Ensifer sp. BR816]
MAASRPAFLSETPEPAASPVRYSLLVEGAGAVADGLDMAFGNEDVQCYSHG